MEDNNLNFTKGEKTKKILEDEKEIHNIFDGANEDEFTKRSRKAIRSNLEQFGMEDPIEEQNKSSKKEVSDDNDLCL